MAEKSEKRRIYIYINDKEVEDSLKSVTAAARKLRNEFATTSDPLKKQEIAKELQKAEARVKSLRDESKGLNGVFGSLKKTIGGNLFAMVSWTAAIGAGISIIKGAYQTIKEYDESVANLSKTTGLAKDEARALASEVIKIDTRTPVTQLLELATAAGRLGLKGQDIVDFTRTADMSFVALGDSLEGDAEQIGLTLGKLASNFDLDKKYGIGEALNKVGSALNELGANSKASEGPIVDFTKRLSGVGAAAKIPITDLQALGALIDESGQSIEVAATTFNVLLPAIGKDVKKFAQVAGMDMDEFSVLVKEKPMEALKAVAIGAKSSEKGLVGLTQTLENYGIESARSASIVTLLSDNTDRLTELQEIANTAFEEGTSLMNEFTIKNKTMEAKTQILSKTWDEFIIGLDGSESVIGNISKDLLDFFTKAVRGLGNLGAAWDTTFGGIASASAETKKKVLTDWETESGMELTMFTSAFDKIPVTDIKNNIKEIRTSFIDLLESNGESYQDASDIFDIYIADRINKEKEYIKTSKEENKTALADKIKEEEEANNKKSEELSNSQKKELEAAKEKAAKEAEVVLKERAKLQEKIDKLKEDAKLKALTDDEAELEQIRQKFARLMEEEAINEEQKKELELLREEELALKEEEQEIKRQEQRQKLLDEQYAFEEEMELIKLEGIDKELAEVDAKYEALYAKADKYGLDTTALQLAHAKEQGLIIKKQAEDELKVTEETQKARRASINATLDSFSSMIGSLEIIFEGSEEMQKGFGFAQIAIDTAKAISSLTAMSEANPTNAVTFGGAGIAQYGAGILRIFANMAQARKYLSFYEGGFTGSGFGLPDASGFKVAGAVHQDEWVGPKWMVESPQYADTFKMLEAARQAKTGFADGGPTTTSSTSTTAPIVDSSDTSNLTTAVNRLSGILEGGIKSTTVIDQNNLLDIKEGLDEINEKQQLFS